MRHLSIEKNNQTFTFDFSVRFETRFLTSSELTLRKGYHYTIIVYNMYIILQFTADTRRRNDALGVIIYQYNNDLLSY